MIKIKSKGVLRDGGSIIYRTNVGTYFVDNRIGTKTKGSIYRDKMKPENLVLEEERIKVKSAIAVFEKPCRCKCGACKN